MTTTPPALTTPPAYPDPNDRPGFAAKAFNWAKFLNDTFHPELIALAQYFYDNADAATQSALDAAGAALIAQQSAASAVNAPGTSATSTTSLTVSTGSKTLSIQTGKQFVIGQPLMIASAANPMLHMYGIITAHNSGTGSLTVNVTGTSGEGAAADWSVGLGVAVVSTLPAQAGHAGQFLKTDGSAVSWVDAVTPDGSQTLSNKTLASPVLTGNATATTQTAGDSSTKLATTAFVAAAISSKANLASPTFTGTPAAPTAAIGTNTTQIATTAFVSAAIASLVNSSPAALDTLNELATALGNDPNFATTITNAMAAKAPLASPALTGTPTAPTPATDDESTRIATTAQVAALISSGRMKFTASGGAIAKGDTVVLNADGTISKVSSTASSALLGDEQVQVTATTAFYDAVDIPGTNNVLIAYNDGAKKMVVATIDPGSRTLTWGTPVACTWYLQAFTSPIVWHPVEGKAIAAYVESSVVYMIEITASTAGCSFGAPSSGGAAVAGGVGLVYNAHQNKVVVTYPATASSVNAKVAHYAVATGFTWGTTPLVLLSTGSSPGGSCMSDISGTPTVLAFYGSTTTSYCRVVSINALTLTGGTQSSAFNFVYSTPSRCFIEASGKAVAFTGQNGNYVIVTISGMTSTPGTVQSLSGFKTGLANPQTAAYDVSAGKFAVFGVDTNDYAIVVMATLSGTALSPESPVYINSTSSATAVIAYNASSQKLLFSYKDIGNLNYGTTRIYDSGDMITTINNWLGIAAQAIANGAVGRVFGKGEICDALSGLSIGSTYYLDNNGVVSMSGTRVLGRAVAANKLLITG